MKWKSKWKQNRMGVKHQRSMVKVTKLTMRHAGGQLIVMSKSKIEKSESQVGFEEFLWRLTLNFSKSYEGQSDPSPKEISSWQNFEIRKCDWSRSRDFEKCWWQCNKTFISSLSNQKRKNCKRSNLHHHQPIRIKVLTVIRWPWLPEMIRYVVRIFDPSFSLRSVVWIFWCGLSVLGRKNGLSGFRTSENPNQESPDDGPDR